MVSSPHEAMHRIFQHDLERFGRVSRILGLGLPTPVKITVLPTDLTETSPVERRVDTLFRLDNPDEARADLALAALSAITHAADPGIGAILKSLSTALRGVPEDIADPIIEFTAQGLGKRPAEQIWRKLVAVDLSFYKSYISEEIRDEKDLSFFSWSRYLVRAAAR